MATADYDGDGWLDIYVANDGTENLLWINQRDGTLVDAALLSGAALSGLGTPEAGMGVDAGDFDDDGDEDLFMTHLTTEGNNLYVNDGSGMFRGRERGVAAGAGQPALHRLGLGVVRLRQRRAARRHGRQRHGGGGGRARRRPVPVRDSATRCSAIWASGASRTSRIEPARCSSCRR